MRVLPTIILFAALLHSKTGLSAASSTTLSGHFSISRGADTVRLVIFEPQLKGGRPVKQAELIEICDDKTGYVSFSLPEIDRPIQFSLYHTSKKIRLAGRLVEVPVFDNYLICPGDSIVIHSDFEMAIFKGHGGARMQHWHDVTLATRRKQMEMDRETYLGDPDSFAKYMARQDTLLAFALRELEIKPMSNYDYVLLRTELIGQNRLRIYQTMAISTFYVQHPAYKNALMYHYGKTYYAQEEEINPDSVWLHSPYYAQYLYYKTIADEQYSHLAIENRSVDALSRRTDGAYMHKFAEKYDGVLKDQLLHIWFRSALRDSDLSSDHYAFLNAEITDASIREYINGQRSTFDKGKGMLDFRFEDREGNLVKLSDYVGKVVFIDIWFTGCGACKNVAVSMPQVERHFVDNDEVVFLSISIDKDKETWMRSIDEHAKPDANYRFSGRYFSGNDINYLYTAGRGSNDEFIKRYNPQGGYPQLLLVDKSGSLFSAAPPRPDLDGGQEKLVAMIDEALGN